MGWKMPWYTITDSFDADFGVDEWAGTNAFIRDGAARVFRTYFITGRGGEALGNSWGFLDMTALGRQESWEDSQPGYPVETDFAYEQLSPGGPSTFRGGRPPAVEPPRDVSSVDYSEGTRLKVVSR